MLYMSCASSDLFQSTLPARGATTYNEEDVCNGLISIHAPREGSDFNGLHAQIALCISIHAPREGSDLTVTSVHPQVEISIHAPREGSDVLALAHLTAVREFQSTLPARGATTGLRVERVLGAQFQSTLPARGATVLVLGIIIVLTISIHAPREGSDNLISAHCVPISGYFNPRSPRGERLRCR